MQSTSVERPVIGPLFMFHLIVRWSLDLLLLLFPYIIVDLRAILYGICTYIVYTLLLCVLFDLSLALLLVLLCGISQHSMVL